MTEWISVKERLPTKEDGFATGFQDEYGVLCLKYGLEKHQEVEILYIRYFDMVADHFEDCGVTHWTSVSVPQVSA